MYRCRLGMHCPQLWARRTMALSSNPPSSLRRFASIWMRSWLRTGQSGREANFVSRAYFILRRARERGREWHYSLDARPLATVYREWLESFAPYFEESLGRLKRRVEEEG